MPGCPREPWGAGNVRLQERDALVQEARVDLDRDVRADGTRLRDGQPLAAARHRRENPVRPVQVALKVYAQRGTDGEIARTISEGAALCPTSA